MKNKHNRSRVDLCQNLLIVLLTISAVVLLCLSPLVQSSGLSDLFSGRLTSSGDSSTTPQSIPVAAVPVRMAVGFSHGLYAAQYDQDAVDDLFSQTAALLGEALSGVGKATAISGGQWQSLLSGQYIYFGYLEPVPLASLCTWLSGEDAPGKLSGSASAILLSPQESGALALCYQEGEHFYLCSTELDAALHLDAVLKSTAPNGAMFAFENEALADVLSPYVLFTGGELRAQTYAAASIPLSDETRVTQLLTALNFSAQNQAEVSGDSIVVDGSETIWLYSDGHVRYYASGNGRYTAENGLSGAVSAAWSLADSALSPLCGDARLYLSSAQEEPSGQYTVTFGYLLNGSPVYLYDQGWAARFQVQNGFVTDFTLYPRCYTAGEESTLLLPADKAAAALASLSDTARELIVQYRDSGSGSVVPGWVAR